MNKRDPCFCKMTGVTGIEMVNSFRALPGDYPIKQSMDPRLLRLKKERRAKKTATVASCQHVGTEFFLQAFRHKRTDHRHSSELSVHIAFQNPSLPGFQITSASDMEVFKTNNGSSHGQCGGPVVARGALCTDSKKVARVSGRGSDAIDPFPGFCGPDHARFFK